MTFKRDYLESEEISFITKAIIYGILKVDDNGDFVKDEDGNYVWEIYPPVSEFERQMLKYDLVAKLLIEDFKSEEPTSIMETYNVLMANSVDLYSEVKNIYLIDEIVEKELSLEKVVERGIDRFIAKVDEASDKIENLDFKTMLVELEKLKDSDAMKMLAKA